MGYADQMAQGATVPQGGGEGPPKHTFTQPGEVVCGRVTKAAHGLKDKFNPGEKQSLVEVDDETRGPVTVWLSNFQLKVAFVEGQNPLGRPVQTGDIIFIQFQGEEFLEGGNTVKNYAVNLAQGPAQQFPAPQQGGPVGAPPPQAYQQPPPAPQGYQPPPLPQGYQPPAPQQAPQPQQAGWQPPQQGYQPPPAPGQQPGDQPPF